MLKFLTTKDKSLEYNFIVILVTQINDIQKLKYERKELLNS